MWGQMRVFTGRNGPRPHRWGCRTLTKPNKEPGSRPDRLEFTSETLSEQLTLALTDFVLFHALAEVKKGMPKGARIREQDLLVFIAASGDFTQRYMGEGARIMAELAGAKAPLDIQIDTAIVERFKVLQGSTAEKFLAGSWSFRMLYRSALKRALALPPLAAMLQMFTATRRPGLPKMSADQAIDAMDAGMLAKMVTAAGLWFGK